MTAKPYPAYKKSGVAWIGNLPGGWSDALQLRHLVACLDSRRIPLNSAERADMPGDVPYWGSGGVVGSVGRPLFDEELVLLGEDGAPFYDRSRPVSFRVDGPTWVNNHIHVLRPRKHVNQVFLVYALNSVDYSLYISGSTRDKLTQDDMWSIRVPLPPFSQQQQIVDYLDAHTAKIDTLIGKQERLIETLAERRQAVISHAVTKGLNPNVTIKDSGVEWLSAIPDTWTIPRVAHHFSIVLGKMVNAGKVNEPGLFDAPYLRAGNVQPYGVDITEAKTMPMSAAELTQLSLRIGDLVVVEGGQGGYGRSALVLADLSGWGYQNHVMRVRPKSYESNAFLDYVIKALRAAGYIASLSSHASLPSFSAEKLAAIRYGRPPVSEQGAIVEYLDHETTQIDALSAKAREMIDVLKERRQALISAAVTGKIDVRGLA